MTFQNILPAPVFHRLTDAFHSLKIEFAEQSKSRAAYRRTFDELSAMCNRDLADIGVDRAEIPRLATQAASLR